jgi:hypothetical protein
VTDTQPVAEQPAPPEDPTPAPEQTALKCPKCGVDMAPLWRGGKGPLRCPQCRGIFLDTEEMRRRRAERKPQPGAIAARVIFNVILSVVLSVVISRWVKRRKEKARLLPEG